MVKTPAKVLCKENSSLMAPKRPSADDSPNSLVVTQGTREY